MFGRRSRDGQKQSRKERLGIEDRSLLSRLRNDDEPSLPDRLKDQQERRRPERHRGRSPARPEVPAADDGRFARDASEPLQRVQSPGNASAADRERKRLTEQILDLNRRAAGSAPPKPREREAGPLANLSPLDLLAIAVGQREPDEETRLKREEEQLRRISVVAFVGSSGTGKSTRAVNVAHREHIDYIIDDGLLIYGSRIVAGTSAKRAPTRMESVRQALFSHETRSATMRRALVEQAPDQLMILGTSDGMIEKICDNLHLRRPDRVIRIEDVSTEEERHLAQSIRITQGQHTIPVPSLEIKHEFSGSFAEPLWRLRTRFGSGRSGQTLPPAGTSPGMDGRTVVRPTFSTRGSYSISDEALKSLARLSAAEVEGLSSVVDIDIRTESYGVVIDAELALVYGYTAQTVMQASQLAIKENIETLTSINVLLINVSARKVVLDSAKQARPGLGTPV